MFFRTLFIALVAAFTLGCAGGNPNAPASISGKVTFKGAPVTGGQVNFYNAQGGMAGSAPLGADGTYTATDMPVGELTITINNEDLNPETAAKDMTSKAGAKTGYASKGAGGKMMYTPDVLKNAGQGTLKYVALPKKYADKSQSGKKATIKSGANKVDIVLD